VDHSSPPPALAGVSIVDADTHICETYDLWTSRAPAAYRARVPQVKEIDGALTWVIDGDKKMGPAFAVNTIRRDGSKGAGMDIMNWKFGDVFEAGYDPEARVAYMDSVGIRAQIAYGNLLGFGNQKGMGADEDLRLVTTQIYNDAMIDFQRETGDRVFPMALLPWWDIEASVAEAERCHAAGLRGVNTSPTPENYGFPVLADEHWSPLWEACEALHMPVNFHVGAAFDSTAWFGTGVWPTHDANSKLVFGGAQMFTSNLQILCNIIVSGMLERFPKLNIVSVESGVGWVPFMLEALDYNMRDNGVKLNLMPSEIFARQIYACSWFERRHLVHSVRSVGVDNVLFQTDFPHPVCLYPEPIKYLADVAAEFAPEERAKVFGGNAARIYNLPTAS
jgi:predicted TIM-barrel fold metal-dependent hydrolase